MCNVSFTAYVAEALINLLDNAAKYSTLHKELLVRLSQENGFIRIAVTDRGIGLLPEDRKRIFENFYRVSNGLVHDVRGNGLGLAITKRIVEAHGGKVTVDSELGRGSTFTLYLRTMTG